MPNQAYGKLARRVGRVGSGPSFLPWLRVCPIRARVPAVLLPAARRARRPAVCVLARHSVSCIFRSSTVCILVCLLCPFALVCIVGEVYTDSLGRCVQCTTPSSKVLVRS